MQFTITMQKAYELAANTTRMSTAKNQQVFKKFRKTTRRVEYNKKTCYWWHGRYRPDMYFKSCKRFVGNTFWKYKPKTTSEIKDFLNAIDIPKLSEDQVKLCEEDLTERDLYKTLRSTRNDKSPGNDGLTQRILWNLLGWTEGNLCRFRKTS